jgi:hypothetical protein
MRRNLKPYNSGDITADSWPTARNGRTLCHRVIRPVAVNLSNTRPVQGSSGAGERVSLRPGYDANSSATSLQVRALRSSHDHRLPNRPAYSSSAQRRECRTKARADDFDSPLVKLAIEVFQETVHSLLDRRLPHGSVD